MGRQIISVQLFWGGVIDASTGRYARIAYAVVLNPNALPWSPWESPLHSGQQYGEGARWHWTIGGEPDAATMAEILRRVAVLTERPLKLREFLDYTDDIPEASPPLPPQSPPKRQRGFWTRALFGE